MNGNGGEHGNLKGMILDTLEIIFFEVLRLETVSTLYFFLMEFYNVTVISLKK